MRTIFVSSTFKDMHFERDAIQEITLPALRGEAARYGESISFCDLRWGINTGDLDSEEGSRKVLDVCLDEIDRCRPPMVVILGDRYGWIPSEKLTAHAAARKQLDREQLKKAMEIEDLQISVTALEIAYGALATPEKRQRALFYFRHIESDCPADYAAEDTEHREKLDRLKARIEALTNGRIRHYTVRWNGERLEGIIPFAQMLADDIREMLLPEWRQKELLTPFERERFTHWSFLAEKNSMFSAREALTQRLYKEITRKDKHFLALTAPSGSGKSMIFSRLALMLREHGFDVLPIVSGLTAESNDSLDLLRHTILYLETLLGLSVGDHHALPTDSDEADGDTPSEHDRGVEHLRERLRELCLACEQAGRHVVIMVDAVDQLAANTHRDQLIFLPEPLCEHVKCFMTCLPELAPAGAETVTLRPMDRAEKQEVIRGILRVHNRELEERVIRRMLRAKASSNPLFLSLLVQRLLMMNRDDFLAIRQAGDDMKAITARQQAIIASCPDSLQSMSALLLTEAGGRINAKLVRHVAQYLSLSRHGLRQEDLATLLRDRWSALDFVHFITYMDESFIRRDDGRFDFSHKCIREGFAMLCEEVSEQHRRLAAHFLRLGLSDPLCVEEMIYHSIMADDREAGRQYLLLADHTPDTLLPAAGTVLSHCRERSDQWLTRLIEETEDRAACIRLCEFVITILPRASSQSREHTRILAHIGQWLCDHLDTRRHADPLYAPITVKAHIRYAECVKSLLLASYYSEGDYALYVHHYREAYRIAAQAAGEDPDSSFLEDMAECAFQLTPHTARTAKASSGHFAGSGHYDPYYGEKAAEHLKAMLRREDRAEWRLKYAISCVSAASFEEFGEGSGRTKTRATQRGENRHIREAIRIAAELDGQAVSAHDLPHFCRLYRDLADYFLDMTNMDYQNTAMHYLGQAISCLRDPDRQRDLPECKQLLFSLLVKYGKYCAAVNRFDDTPKYRSEAISLAHELYRKTQRVNLLYDMIGLYNCYLTSMTRKGTDFSDIGALMRLSEEFGRYFDSTDILPASDRLLLRALLLRVRVCLSPSRPGLGARVLDRVADDARLAAVLLALLLRSQKSVKASYWLTPYFGAIARLLRECAKTDDHVRRVTRCWSRFIVFYVKCLIQKKGESARR